MLEVSFFSSGQHEEADLRIPVYCVLSVKGRPANVRRQSVSVVEWMRRDGSWQYFNASVLRGLDGSYMHNAQRR